MNSKTMWLLTNTYECRTMCYSFLHRRQWYSRIHKFPFRNSIETPLLLVWNELKYDWYSTINFEIWKHKTFEPRNATEMARACSRKTNFQLFTLFEMVCGATKKHCLLTMCECMTNHTKCLNSLDKWSSLFQYQFIKYKI